MKGRTSYVIKNSTYSIISQIINIIIKFGVRTVFIITLGKEYLGINSVFTNILTMLSLTELGVGTAIVYDMYKPIAENNTSRILGYMQIFKKVYAIIGVIIFALGLLVIPFLDNILTDVESIPNIVLIYILFLLDSVSSYFFAHYRSLVGAYQKNYINTTNTIIFNIIKSIFQLIILLLFKNFILYLTVQIFFNVLGNYVLSIKVKKMFPYIKEKEYEKIPKHDVIKIIKNSFSLFSLKVSAIVLNSTDNILLSSFISTIITGVYSNYNLIISTVQQTVFLIVNSLQASLGNLCATETKEKCKTVFFNLLFTYSWIYCFLSVGISLLISNVIYVWIGKDYILAQSLIYIIVFNFYLAGVRQATSGFYTANGLFRYFKVSPWIEVIINIGLSIILVNLIGINGIFIATTISHLLTKLWFEPYILFKYGFEDKLRLYFKKYVSYFSILVVSFIIVYICNIVFIEFNIINFIIKGAIAVIAPNVLYYLIFYKSEEFKYVKELLKKMYNKIFREESIA